MNKLSSSILLATSSLLLSQGLQAGAWVANEGEGYIKYGVSNSQADKVFGGNATFKEFKGTNYSFYGERGLGNKLSLYGSALYQDIEQTTSDGNTLDNSGIGDVEVGLKKQLSDGPFVISVAGLIKIPSLYDEDDALALGNGQFDYEARFLLGKSLNQYGYFGIEFGYRFRDEAPSDEYRYLIEYGYSITPSWYVRTKLDGIKSVRNADVVDSGNGNFATAPEFDLAKLELTTGFNLGKKTKSGSQWGLEFTYIKDAFGDQALNGDGFQVGLTKVF